MIIIFMNSENKVSTITPSDEFLEKYGIELIAEKDVPKGLLYKILDNSELASVIQYPQELWEVDINESNCDGVGLSKKEFDIKYPEYNWMGVVE